MDFLVIDDDYDIKVIKNFDLKINTQIIFVLDIKDKAFIQKLTKSLKDGFRYGIIYQNKLFLYHIYDINFGKKNKKWKQDLKSIINSKLKNDSKLKYKFTDQEHQDLMDELYPQDEQPKMLNIKKQEIERQLRINQKAKEEMEKIKQKRESEKRANAINFIINRGDTRNLGKILPNVPK